MRQVILGATYGAHPPMGAGTNSHLGSFSPCAPAIDAPPQGANTARTPQWALDAEGQPTPRHRDGSWGRSAGMLTYHVSACICEGNSGQRGRSASGLVTSALQPVTSALQARHAKYIFATQIPSGPRTCVIPACNVRRTPPFFPFGNSLSCPVERYFDRPVYIPNLTDKLPVGNIPQKTRALFSSNIKGFCAHPENRSAP
jgi:hypothetical protein